MYPQLHDSNILSMLYSTKKLLMLRMILIIASDVRKLREYLYVYLATKSPTLNIVLLQLMYGIFILDLCLSFSNCKVIGTFKCVV